MKTQAITLSDESYQLLGEFAAHQGRPISWIVEESLWLHPEWIEYAAERGIEKPERGRPGRPRPKKEA